MHLVMGKEDYQKQAVGSYVIQLGEKSFGVNFVNCESKISKALKNDDKKLVTVTAK